jgi:hypothetical protein
MPVKFFLEIAALFVRGKSTLGEMGFKVRNDGETIC